MAYDDNSQYHRGIWITRDLTNSAQDLTNGDAVAITNLRLGVVHFSTVTAAVVIMRTNEASPVELARVNLAANSDTTRTFDMFIEPGVEFLTAAASADTKITATYWTAKTYEIKDAT